MESVRSTRSAEWIPAGEAVLGPVSEQERYFDLLELRNLHTVFYQDFVYLFRKRLTNMLDLLSNRFQSRPLFASNIDPLGGVWAQLWRAPFWVDCITNIGIVALVITLQQAQQANEILHTDFVANNRPRVRFRFVQGLFKDSEADQGTENELAYVTVVNAGVADAILDGVGSDLAVRSESTGKWLGAGLNAGIVDARAPVRLKGGEQHTFPVRTTEPIGAEELFGLQEGSWVLYLVFQVRYRDENGTIRRMAALRAYNWKRETFYKPDKIEEGFEYED